MGSATRRSRTGDWLGLVWGPTKSETAWENGMLSHTRAIGWLRNAHAANDCSGNDEK